MRGQTGGSLVSGQTDTKGEEGSRLCRGPLELPGFLTGHFLPLSLCLSSCLPDIQTAR